MGIPVGLGLKLASVGTKASSFMGTIWVKLILVALALAALAFSAHVLINEFQKHEKAIYNDGFGAGIAAEKARWERESAANARAQRDQVVADVKQQNTAVKAYLDDLSARQPQIVKVKEEVVRYAQGPAGNAQCLDDDGVRLLIQGREAAGFVGQTGTPAAAPGPVR